MIRMRGQGSKEMRALRSAIPHQENSGIMRFQTIFTLLLLSSCKISPLVSTLGRRSSLEKYWCNIWQRKISHYLRIFYRTFCLESFYELGHLIARTNWTFCKMLKLLWMIQHEKYFSEMKMEILKLKTGLEIKYFEKSLNLTSPP